MDRLIRDANPFRTVGFPDADELLVKQQGVELLRRRLNESGMTQAELAQKAGLEPSHVSEMLSGRLARFGIERINRALAVFHAEIKVSYDLIGD